MLATSEGCWTFRVEGWSDPWETWVHNAEIKIPAGIDVDLVCTEGKALFSGRGGPGATSAGATADRRAAPRGRRRAWTPASRSRTGSRSCSPTTSGPR